MDDQSHTMRTPYIKGKPILQHFAELINSYEKSAPSSPQSDSACGFNPVDCSSGLPGASNKFFYYLFNTILDELNK